MTGVRFPHRVPKFMQDIQEVKVRGFIPLSRKGSAVQIRSPATKNLTVYDILVRRGTSNPHFYTLVIANR
jgi:hypothetical protein